MTNSEKRTKITIILSAAAGFAIMGAMFWNDYTQRGLLPFADGNREISFKNYDRLQALAISKKKCEPAIDAIRAGRTEDGRVSVSTYKMALREFERCESSETRNLRANNRTYFKNL